ncbi:MAG TPA: sigma-54 dependent transcriptional regulator [Candidatus Binatia bacterium]|jgi:DNA-binding NtrC family response regulator
MTQETAAPAQPARILVVEDESIVAFDIATRLRRLGHVVVGTARSAEVAWQLCEEHRPDLVLMDVRIEGDEDGIDLATRLRARFDIPVVFLTAYADPVTLERARAAAPLGYIVKPFDQRDIEVTVQTALGRGAIHRDLQRAHDELRGVLDAQRHGTLAIDADGHVALASRAALALVAKEETQVRGRPWQDALGLSAADRSRLEDAAVDPSSNGATVLVQVPGRAGLASAVEVEVCEDHRTPGGRLFFLYDVSRVVTLERILDERARFGDIVGTSDPMKQIFLLIRDYGAVEVPVLVDGETGSGKELVARAIHQSSSRAERGFVAVNCAGLSDELAASQLFGHARGAFTDAVGDYEGLFRAANGGTLFLDEIGELSARVQASLLRVLDERVVYPVGRTRGEPVDVRIVAATNRDLAEEVRTGRFRADLYYRVRAARINVPPLRERKEDIAQLVRHFLATQSAVTGKTVRGIGNETLRLLHLYDWPGNVRELRNAVAVAAARAFGDLIQPEDLPVEILDGAAAAASVPQGPVASRLELLEALHRCGGNRSQAARLLGVSRATFYRRLAELGA